MSEVAQDARSAGSAARRPHHETPDGAITAPLDDALSPDDFTPRLLALLSNALVWRESHELRRRFGLGTNDWRVISALAVRPGTSATDIGDFLGVNKAVVSKSVNLLLDRGLILVSDGPRGSRPLFLSEPGAQMHRLMLPISMRGQEIILEGMTGAEIDVLNARLRDMLDRVRADADGS